jgi:gluconolactonase
VVNCDANSTSLRWGSQFDSIVTRYPPTNEMFFVQNAGAPAAGTGMWATLSKQHYFLLESCAKTLHKGLNKSSIIQKIKLAEADAVSTQRNATGLVQIHVVESNPTVLNPNGKLLKKSM